MLDYTSTEKAGYNSISYNEQITNIMNNKSCYNKLRAVQKTNLNNIRRKVNTTKQSLTQEEKDYVFNLYYNFVVNQFTFDKSEPIVIAEPEPKATHIGMRMLEQLKSES